jgi:hypothetical protein
MTNRKKKVARSAPPDDKPKHELSRYELRKAGLLIKPDARKRTN